ncbi:MAG TPA: flagellar biosynthetic protein FliO [Lachnospiraceae bacterium]|nr:flagellar biosynthetic protein FliO [Lachnospiraceae bacterium]
MGALLGLETSALESFAQLVTVILIFIFVLALTYFTTRFVGRYQKTQMQNKNIEVIETFKITANKFIQIVRTGDKYLVIAIGKDTVTMLSELSEEELDFTPSEVKGTENFQEILTKAKELVHKKQK